MKNYYVSTFISGLSDVIKKLLISNLSDVEIIELFDGMVIYKTQYYQDVTRLKFLNNSFLLLGQMKTNNNNEFNVDLNNLVKKLNIDYSAIKLHIEKSKNKNFKILSIDKNQPVSINFRLIENLENSISKNLNVKLNKKNPDLEFCFLRRSEGVMVFMVKITYNRLTEKDINKGELRPELAYILASLAELNKNKIVIDPFCGHGSIPRQIVKNFKYNMCFASDTDVALIERLKNEYKKNNKKLFIKVRDALALEGFENDFIDVIITDPPWNMFESKNNDFLFFYKAMLVEFNRILKNDGRMIILMGNVNVFEKALYETKFFDIKIQYNILVNGKKANIYMLEKSSC
ncbi:MAG: methyltransferase [Oscillospiraceae bacterium]|nr:methyltransferase [Oscillospiraceae bacterium]